MPDQEGKIIEDESGWFFEGTMNWLGWETHRHLFGPTTLQRWMSKHFEFKLKLRTHPGTYATAKTAAKKVFKKLQDEHFGNAEGLFFSNLKLVFLTRKEFEVDDMELSF